MEIFLISGKARHGKDTIAQMILEETNGVVIPFAKTIKQYAKDYMGWDGTEETKPREFLQVIGTEVIREELNDPDFHARRVCEDIDVLKRFFDTFVIPDCRYPNELEYVKNHFYETGDAIVSIRVDRPNFDNGLTEEQKNHKSEISMDRYTDFDFNFVNNGLDNLKEQVLDMLNE